jgi:hypothetical protein
MLRFPDTYSLPGLPPASCLYLCSLESSSLKLNDIVHDKIYKHVYF